jgi:hypothetical protein
MFVSGYPSIDMYCIVLSVKFDGGLFITILKNKQLFKKKGRQKFTFSRSSHFQEVHIFLILQITRDVNYSFNEGGQSEGVMFFDPAGTKPSPSKTNQQCVASSY